MINPVLCSSELEHLIQSDVSEKHEHGEPPQNLEFLLYRNKRVYTRFQ